MKQDWELSWTYLLYVDANTQGFERTWALYRRRKVMGRNNIEHWCGCSAPLAV